MGTMTVLITAMSTTALRECLERALPISLPVPTIAASHIPGVVTLITTAGTVQMKLTAVSSPIEAINLLETCFVKSKHKIDRSRASSPNSVQWQNFISGTELLANMVEKDRHSY